MLRQPHRIETRYPFADPTVIQLFSSNTPNGKKVSIALEELGLPYEPHRIDITEGDQHTDEYRSLSPNGKIPAIVDPNGPGGQALGLMESGAILLYLAKKAGGLWPQSQAAQFQCLEWLFFQVGHVGPMFGQLGHFHKFARKTCPHPYPIERYRKETMRLLRVLDERLRGRNFLIGDYTIADVATFPWVESVIGYYQAADLVEFEQYERVGEWLQRCMQRPASIAGSKVCAS